MKQSKVRLWFEQFNKIFILNLARESKRRSFILWQLEKMGLGDLVGSKIHFHLTTLHPLELNYSLELNSHKNRVHLFRPSEYSCAREHYTLVKTSIELGYSKIMIIEDDTSFMNNLDKMAEILGNAPEDADFLRFHVCSTFDKFRDVKAFNKHWKKDAFSAWNATCTAFMTLKSMKYYVVFQDKKFQVADMPYFMIPANHKKIKSYIPIIPLAIQEKSFASSIRNASNDRINYETDNIFEEYIDVHDYFNLEEFEKEKEKDNGNIL